ncbi:MAG TPA: tetratricopeptide repeat protein [Phycisphaerae bacterium]|nr:tetratricopeptide repeat protein [Phycisphaerae bacterium]HRW54561.1 tetratricopeptide repeat protein [Phycisphaerae bacterium]
MAIFDSDSIDDLTGKARDAYKAGLTADARAILRRLVELDPLDSSHWVLLGHSQMDLGDHESAADSFVRALELNPGSASALSGLGRCHLELKRLDQALVCFERAADLKPTPAKLVLLGVAQNRNGDTPAAIESLQKALELDPDFDEAMFNLGVIIREDDPSRAESLFRKSISISPDYSHPHRELGFVLIRSGRTDEGRTSLETAIRLAPDDFWAHVYLSLNLSETGEIDEAALELERAIEIDPSIEYPYERLHELLLEMGKQPEAARCAAALKALRERNPAD